MTTPTWPPQPQQQPPVLNGSAAEPAEGPQPEQQRRFSTRLRIIGAAVGGLILGIAIGASAANATTSSRQAAAAPPVTRTVTVTPAPTVSLPAATYVPAPVTTEKAAQAQGALQSLSPGTYEVGIGPGQAAPGKYKSSGPEGSHICYCARLKNNDGAVDDIINNNITQGPSVFTIKPSDGYVEVNGCTFTKA